MAYGQSAFAKAEQLFQDKKYDQALIVFKKLYQQDSSNKKILERLGDIAGRQNDLETAIVYYKKLVDREPNNANYNFKYGGTLGLHAKNVSKFKALGMLDDVKRHLQKAADLDTQHIEVRHALSQMYCELPGIVGGSIKKSRAYADELLAISPVDGHLAHGFIDEYEKEYDKAVVSYRKAIETGGSMLTYRKLINVYKKHLRDDKATREVLKEAYKVHPSPSLKAEITALEKS